MDLKTKELSDFADNTPGMIYNLRLFPDGHSCLTYVSEGIKSLCNLNPADVLADASPFFEKVHPEDVVALKNSINLSAHNLSDWYYEFRIINPDLSVRWLVGSSRPRRLEDGSILWSGIILDITTGKNLDYELSKTNRFISVIAQINQMAIHSQKRDEILKDACKILIVYGNLSFAWIDFNDKGNEQSRSFAWSSFNNPENLEGFTQLHVENFCHLEGPHVRAVEKNKTIVVNDIEESFDFGEWRRSSLESGFSSCISLPILFQGKVAGSFNLFSSNKNFFNQTEAELLEKVTKNISYALDASYNEEKRQRAEKELQKSETNFRLIFEEAPLGIAIIDSLDGTFYNINPKYLKIIGRSEKEMEGMDWMRITHPEDVQKDLDNMTLLNANKISDFKMTKRYFKPDGSLVWINMSIVPLERGENGRRRHLCMVEDITESQMAAIKLEKSEEMLKAITNLSPDIISILDREFRPVFISSSTLAVHGYETSQLLNRRITDLIHADDLAHVQNVLGYLVNHPGGYASLQYRYMNRDGKYVWIETTGFNQLNNPSISGMITISRDISARKKLEDDLKFALALKDEFLAIASHELKTPVTSLKLLLQMFSKEMSNTDMLSPKMIKLSKFLGNSTTQVNRITSLIENLLDVTRIKSGSLKLKFEEFNLSESLENFIERYGEILQGAKCEVKLDIQKNIVATLDKDRIEQVFVNLISNAVKYAPSCLLEIKLGLKNERIFLSVADQGPGIPQEKQDSIFNRFERGIESRNMSGLGLGLFITKKVIEAHSGQISVESRLNSGTKFIVDLPLKPTFS